MKDAKLPLKKRLFKQLKRISSLIFDFLKKIFLSCLLGAMMASPFVLTFVSGLLLGVANNPYIPYKFNAAKPIVSYASESVADAFPHTTWHHVEPCGKYFNEEQEMKRALKCVAEQDALPEELNFDEIYIPRCFVITASSPEVMTKGTFNFVPMLSPFGMSAVVGYYDTEQDTIFVVGNNDSSMIYRHELQHYFLDLTTDGDGGGHHQEIWQKCEPPYYKESLESQILNSLKELERLRSK